MVLSCDSFLTFTHYYIRITRITRIHPCRHNCHGWPSAGEKSLKLINTPSHSPNDGQASPCLNSYPHRLFHPILVLPHHCPIIHAPQSINSDLPFCSCKPGYMLFLELFDTVLMKSTKIHSPLQTITHNLTPPSLQVKLPLKNPIIPIVSKFHPNLSYLIYIPLETHQPVKRRDRRWHGHPLSPQFSLYWF